MSGANAHVRVVGERVWSESGLCACALRGVVGVAESTAVTRQSALERELRVRLRPYGRKGLQHSF